MTVVTSQGLRMRVWNRGGRTQSKERQFLVRCGTMRGLDSDS